MLCNSCLRPMTENKNSYTCRACGHTTLKCKRENRAPHPSLQKTVKKANFYDYLGNFSYQSLRVLTMAILILGFFLLLMFLMDHAYPYGGV